MKSEPTTYSIDDLAKDRKTCWDGVRNYQARNFMRDEMKIGDLILFYHSKCQPPGVVGIAKVSSKPYPDSTALDPKSKYYDAKASKENPIWMLVDIEFVRKLNLISLPEIKASPSLNGMLLTKKGMRLSIQPVDANHFKTKERNYNFIDLVDQTQE